MDTNRIIKIEELEIGDEILVPSNCQFKYYRILQKPRINPKTGKWSAVKCSFKAEKITTVIYPNTRWQRNKTVTKYFCTSEDHNIKISIGGFHHKHMWLVKREEKW